MVEKTTFWTLFHESIIVQALLTIMFGGAICYLYVSGQPVPQDLLQLGYVTIAFWMGTKSQHAIESVSRDMRRMRDDRGEYIPF